MHNIGTSNQAAAMRRVLEVVGRKPAALIPRLLHVVHLHQGRLRRRFASLASPTAWNARNLASYFPDKVTTIRRLAAILTLMLGAALVRIAIRDIAALDGRLQHFASNDDLLTQLVPSFMFAVLCGYLAFAAWRGKWSNGPMFQD